MYATLKKLGEGAGPGNETSFNYDPPPPNSMCYASCDTLGDRLDFKFV